MCGICGFITNKRISRDNLIKMNRTLAHRGPDDHGEELYPIGSDMCVGFAQRRLSIIDLSVRGHQPMHSVDNRVSVIFNGEIYNFQELRKDIKDYPFQSNSDTEVIIAAYLKWGIDFVDKINGMFAIAIFDYKDNSLYLIRDRIGKKPLYYYVKDNHNVVFASELKAIIECDIFEQEINREVIGRFLHKQYIVEPDTIYRNTYKLEAGGILKICNGSLEKYKYWDVAEKYHELKYDRVEKYEDAKGRLKELLEKAVSQRLVADVPVGAFLSGGYDSSLVCAIAQKQTLQPVKTFCIGFYEEGYNEAVYAKKIANYIGTEHEELYISEHEMLDLLESIPIYYDEPFADSSQIPTMAVSQLAKQKVSVVLTGDGGDELFGGYNIYTALQKAQILENDVQKSNLSSSEWMKMPIEYRIACDDTSISHRTQAGAPSYVECIDKILLKGGSYFYDFEGKYREERYDIRRMLLDMDTYLTGDILTKVDRASMKYALECRCPILDKNIIEFSFCLPWNYKDDCGNQKRILKDIAYEYIPEELLMRPKSGFSIPLDKWLRGALKERILDWTNKKFLVEQGIFEPDETISMVNNYMENGDQGKWSGANYSKIVWPYFIFQQWFMNYQIKGKDNNGYQNQCNYTSL